MVPKYYQLGTIKYAFIGYFDIIFSDALMRVHIDRLFRSRSWRSFFGNPSMLSLANSIDIRFITKTEVRLNYPQHRTISFHPLFITRSVTKLMMKH